MDSLASLLQKQQELATKIETLREQQKKEGLEKIIDLVEKYQLTTSEVTAAIGKSGRAGRKRGKVAPKYQDPVSGITWTGRGKAPAWIAGRDREPFLIVSQRSA